MWYDLKRFQLDHINEVLTKLNDGSLDDEIWGKIVVMERCKRIAKAYLRKPTVIIDGSEEEFDGKTLGFNYFNNPLRDEYTKELRSKIGDGVIIKMDNQGNIKAMARGSTPVFVQGWKDGKTHCTSDKVIRNQGKLITKTGTNPASDKDRIVKIFDMQRFNQCVERNFYETESNAQSLLLKTCVRAALVKDGGAADPMKTPCWFMIINLVALDMLKTKLPSICVSPILNPIHGNTERNQLSSAMSQVKPLTPYNNSTASDLYSNPVALTQLIAAVVQQANSTHVGTQPSTLNVEQLAQIVNTLTNPTVLTTAVQKNLQKGNNSSTNLSMSPSTLSTKNPNCHQRRVRSFSDSDTELESRAASIRGPSANHGSPTGSSSGISSVSHNKPRSKAAKNTEALHHQSKSPRWESEFPKVFKLGNKDKLDKQICPRLSKSLFENLKPAEVTVKKPWKSCSSTTSDYDSNREVFDSGSWSSNSLVSTNSQNGEEPRSYSPSIGSESDQQLSAPETPEDLRKSVSNDIGEQTDRPVKRRHHHPQCLPVSLDTPATAKATKCRETTVEKPEVVTASETVAQQVPKLVRSKCSFTQKFPTIKNSTGLTQSADKPLSYSCKKSNPNLANDRVASVDDNDNFMQQQQQSSNQRNSPSSQRSTVDVRLQTAVEQSRPFSRQPLTDFSATHSELQLKKQDCYSVGIRTTDFAKESELVFPEVIDSPRRPVPVSSVSSASRSNTSVFRNLLSTFRRSRSSPNKADHQPPPQSVKLAQRGLPYSTTEIQSMDPSLLYHQRANINQATTHHRRSYTNIEQFNGMQVLHDYRYVWKAPVIESSTGRSFTMIPTTKSDFQEPSLAGIGTQPGPPFGPHHYNNNLKFRHQVFNPHLFKPINLEVKHRTSNLSRQSDCISSNSLPRWPRQWNDGYNPINGAVSVQPSWIIPNTSTKTPKINSNTLFCDINPMWGTTSDIITATHRHPQARQYLWTASSPMCAAYETSARSSNNRDYMHGESVAGASHRRC